MIHEASRSCGPVGEVDDDRRQGDGGDHELEPGEEDPDAEHREQHDAGFGDPSAECRALPLATPADAGDAAVAAVAARSALAMPLLHRRLPRGRKRRAAWLAMVARRALEDSQPEPGRLTIDAVARPSSPTA